MPVYICSTDKDEIKNIETQMGVNKKIKYTRIKGLIFIVTPIKLMQCNMVMIFIFMIMEL